MKHFTGGYSRTDVLRLSSEEERFAKAWMREKGPQKHHMAFIVDKKLASVDINDAFDADDAYALDTRDASWNKIGRQKKLFISPTLDEEDELENDEQQVITESEFDSHWKIANSKKFIHSTNNNDEINDSSQPHFDKEWDLSSLNKKFINSAGRNGGEEEEDYRLEEMDKDWNCNLGGVKASFLPPRGTEEDEEKEYASHEFDQEWSMSGLKRVIRGHAETKSTYQLVVFNSSLSYFCICYYVASGTAASTDPAEDEEPDLGEVEFDDEEGWGGVTTTCN